MKDKEGQGLKLIGLILQGRGNYAGLAQMDRLTKRELEESSLAVKRGRVQRKLILERDMEKDWRREKKEVY